MAWEIEKRTSIEVALDPVEVRLSDEAALKRNPFLYLAGDAALPTFDDADVARLRRVLQTGGFLVIDGADPRPGGGFDQSVRALVARLFPREPLHKIAPDHVVYKSFYLLKTPVGRVAAVPYLEGVTHDGRLVDRLLAERHGRRLGARQLRRSGSTRCCPAATRSASSRSASASTWRCTRSASTTRPTRCTCRSSCAAGSGSRAERRPDAD